MADSCCGTSTRQPVDGAKALAAAIAVPRARDNVQAALRAELVPIAGGFFEMGTRRSRYPQDLDSPRRKVFVSSFLIAPHSVTNEQFRRFAEATGYRTIAEREGWSFVFHLLLENASKYLSPHGLDWWRAVDGACWHAPEGSGSSIENREHHPVVHVSWFDALAYAQWAGLRLLREAEWERAARGGHERRKFPWGNVLEPDGHHAMNVWQGTFPTENTAADGYIGTAPATAYKPNDYGLYAMTGNVWEWVDDWFGPLPSGPLSARRDPTGPAEGREKVQRGGSYLCHESYCDRYHVHSRTRTTPDSSTGNCGFRVGASQAE